MTNSIADSDAKRLAINDYIQMDLKVVNIAKKHNVSVSTLADWVREAGIPRRPRGRRLLTSPSPRARQVLAFAAAHGFSRAAKRFKVSRQRVSGLARRWAVLAPQRPTVRSETLEIKSRSGKHTREPRRELVICFRLRADELSLLRESLPQSVAQSTRSPHRLVRAAVLETLENARMFRQQMQSEQSIVAPRVVTSNGQSL